jgi:spermidine/putrescine transport system permease protein
MSGAAPHRRFPGIGLFAAFFFAFLYAPILVLIALSFNANQTASIWTGFTTLWYAVAFQDPALSDALWNSLIVASAATLGSTLLGLLAALGTQRPFPGRALALGLISGPLLIPEIASGISSLLFFVAVGMPLSLLTVIIAHVVFCLPFAYFPIRARLEGMDPRLKEAAADLYADEWRTFRRVTLPQLWPGILAGAMLAFITSIDDFVTTLLGAGAGDTTLPTFIFSLIKVGISPKINAISTVVLGASILFVSVSLLLGRRQRLAQARL